MNPILVEIVTPDGGETEQDENDGNGTFHLKHGGDSLLSGSPQRRLHISDLKFSRSVSTFQRIPEEGRRIGAVNALIAQPQSPLVEHMSLQPDFSRQGRAGRESAATQRATIDEHFE